VFAHPHPQYGGTMHTKTVYQGAKALSRIGCAVLRFNFRGVGASEGTFDRGEGEQEDFVAALDYMAAKYPGTKLWAAGFSFGSWVALEVGAADDRVSVLIGIAPPVVTSVSGQDYQFQNTVASEKPKFFVQGEADEVCPLEGMWQFYGQLKEPKELVVIDGADHLFDGKTPEVGEALEDLLADFSESGEPSS
jgi:alpha/beta superfamily hydrolase